MRYRARARRSGDTPYVLAEAPIEAHDRRKGPVRVGEAVVVMAAPPVQSPPDTDLPPRSLFDAQRNCYYAKPRLRGWSHLLWFEVSLVVGTLLIAAARSDLEVTAAAIYATAVSGLFGASALYHRGNWNPSVSRILQRVDHAMIFMMIAGTATPVFLLAAPGGYGIVCLVVLWSLTLLATGLHLVWMQAPERLVGATFVALGLAGSLALPQVWLHRGVAAAVLLLAGGLWYLVGALAYHRRWPDPAPAWFGYHEVFHACVCAAATCQYIAIAFFIL